MNSTLRCNGKPEIPAPLFVNSLTWQGFSCNSLTCRAFERQLRTMSELSSPLVTPSTGVFLLWGGDAMSPHVWSGIQSLPPESSPFKTFRCVIDNAEVVSRSVKKNVVACFTNLIAPWDRDVEALRLDPPSHIDVRNMIMTRKRKKEYEAHQVVEKRQAAQEEAREAIGARRRAFREKVANRPVRTMRIVDRCGNIRTY